jgi:predicted HicB family RNase H-like nuclease
MNNILSYNGFIGSVHFSAETARTNGKSLNRFVNEVLSHAVI